MELSEIVVLLLHNFQDKHAQNNSGIYDDERTHTGRAGVRVKQLTYVLNTR